MRPEPWIYRIPVRLRSLFRQAAGQDDELRDHLERKTAEYVLRAMVGKGAFIRLTTKDAEALRAVHDFLRL